MGILTNFLKLLKPEENDYYNAITEQAENWQKVDDWAKGIDDSNKKKLDKGNVSVEYDTAKKIEDKIKAVQRTADGKVSKTGDTMTGSLQIDVTNNHIELINNRTKIGTIKAEANTLTITNLVSKKVIQLTNTGSAYIQANNLETNEKEVVASINGLNGKKQDKLRKERILTASDNLDDVVEVGDYRCANIGIDKFSSAEIPINSYYGYGLLKVRSLQTNSIIQEYIPLNDNEGKRPRLYRFRWENPTNWSSWITILNYDSYPFLGALGTQYKITAIQKEGRKEAGQIYYDEVTGKIYKARISNNDKDVTSNFIDITNKGLSDKIESNNRKLLFSGGASTATIPKHILEKYDYLYIHLENTVSSKTPLPCFVEVEDLFSSNVEQLLFGIPDGAAGILQVGIEYSQSTGILKASGGGYFTKIVGYKWYHRED